MKTMTLGKVVLGMTSMIVSSAWGDPREIQGVDPDVPIFPLGPGSLVGVETMDGLYEGSSCTCLLSETTLSCWGSNFYGEAPRLVQGYHHARQVLSNGHQTCVLDDDGVWCMGSGEGNQLPALRHP